MEKDTRSMEINVPKQRFFSNRLAPPLRKKITSPRICKRTYRRPSESTLKRYTLPPAELLPNDELKKAQIILPFKIYTKVQNRDRFLKKKEIPIIKKYKIISTDLQNRLHVNDPPDDVATLVDIDENFYKCVNNRNLTFNYSIFKSFKAQVNKVLQTKLESGSRKDCTLNIDINFRNEERVYKLALDRLTNQAKNFDTFISEDYRNSRELLAKWDNLKVQVESKSLELQNLAVEKFTIMARIIGLEYNFNLQQKYGRFLYYLSPPSWRLKNRYFARSVEIEAKGFDYGDSCEEENFTVIFEKMRRLCVDAPVYPALYFSHPKDLIDVFETLEEQQLHNFVHVNNLTPYTKMLKDGIKRLEDLIVKETSSIKIYIRKFENVLKESEERCDYLKTKFFKILYGLFYESVGAIDVLKYKLHLEFCFEKVFLEKPINMDLVTLASSIEKLYMDYSKRLDTIKSSSVRRALQRCVNTEKLKSRRAIYAANELRLFYRLEKELLRAHGFPSEIIYKPVKTCASKTTSKFKIENNIEVDKNDILNEAEKEYLNLFTDWTPNEDPGKYLQSLNLKEYSNRNTKL